MNKIRTAIWRFIYEWELDKINLEDVIIGVLIFVGVPVLIYGLGTMLGMI